MKLPRDLSGTEVARRLARHYGYRVTRSRGSHMTVTRIMNDKTHQVTVPAMCASARSTRSSPMWRRSLA